MALVEQRVKRLEEREANESCCHGYFKRQIEQKCQINRPSERDSGCNPMGHLPVHYGRIIPWLIGQFRDLFQRPDVIADRGLHRWRDVQGLMNLGEVVEHIVQCHGAGVVCHLLTKAVRQPSKAAHVHPRREVLALDVAG